MTEDEAKRVFVPFGRCKGWPLSAVIEKHPQEWKRLQKWRLYGEIAEAVRALAGAGARKGARSSRQRRPPADPWTNWIMQ